MGLFESKTLTGLTIAQVREKLDAILPAEAYTKIGGTKLDLTDIDPNWMRRAYNGIFGVCGRGWGTTFDTSDLIREKEGNGSIPTVIVKKMVLWYILTDGSGKEIRCEVPATGSNTSQQGNIGFAMKGALTNAMGNAASQMGWQESVYLGYRSHNDTKASAPKASAPKASAPKVSKTPPVVATTPAKEPLPPFPPISVQKTADVPPVPQPAATPAPSKGRPPSTAEQIKADIEKITSLCKIAGLKTRIDHFGKIGEILGRPVKSWVDVTNANDRLKIIETLESTRIDPPAPLRTPQPSLGRKQKLPGIFELAGRFGCKTPEDACEEVSSIIGRVIKSSDELTDAEVDKTFKELTELVAGLGL